MEKKRKKAFGKWKAFDLQTYFLMHAFGEPPKM